jgi:hypothetical protein
MNTNESTQTSTYVVTVLVDGVEGGTYTVGTARSGGPDTTRAASMYFAAVKAGEAVAPTSDFPGLSYVVN